MTFALLAGRKYPCVVFDQIKRPGGGAINFALLGERGLASRYRDS